MNSISNIAGSSNTLAWENIKNTSSEIQNANIAPAHPVNASDAVVDSVQTRQASKEPTLIPDEDVDRVLAETIQYIFDDPYAALHVHSGLDASRVAALLA